MKLVIVFVALGSAIAVFLMAGCAERAAELSSRADEAVVLSTPTVEVVPSSSAIPLGAQTSALPSGDSSSGQGATIFYGDVECLATDPVTSAYSTFDPSSRGADTIAGAIDAFFDFDPSGAFAGRSELEDPEVRLLSDVRPDDAAWATADPLLPGVDNASASVQFRRDGRVLAEAFVSVPPAGGWFVGEMVACSEFTLGYG